MNLSGRKYALVTGASSGIGREYARQTAARGYNLVMVSDRAGENETAAREIAAQYGVEAHALCMDLTAVDAAERLWTWTQEREMEVEVLVCNAGMLLFGGVLSASPEKIGRLVALHCTVNTQLCRYYAPAMQARGRGYILLMSSATAWMPYPTVAVYSATKAYLRNFAQAFCAEVAEYGVHVTAVFPGAVDTPLYELGGTMRRRLVRWGVMSSPSYVAHKGLRALFRGRKRCIPGFFTKVCVVVCRLLPGWMICLAVQLPAVRRLL